MHYSRNISLSKHITLVKFMPAMTLVATIFAIMIMETLSPLTAFSQEENIEEKASNNPSNSEISSEKSSEEKELEKKQYYINKLKEKETYNDIVIFDGQNVEKIMPHGVSILYDNVQKTLLDKFIITGDLGNKDKFTKRADKDESFISPLEKIISGTIFSSDTQNTTGKSKDKLQKNTDIINNISNIFEEKKELEEVNIYISSILFTDELDYSIWINDEITRSSLDKDLYKIIITNISKNSIEMIIVPQNELYEKLIKLNLKDNFIAVNDNVKNIIKEKYQYNFDYAAINNSLLINSTTGVILVKLNIGDNINLVNLTFSSQHPITWVKYSNPDKEQNSIAENNKNLNALGEDDKLVQKLLENNKGYNIPTMRRINKKYSNDFIDKNGNEVEKSFLKPISAENIENKVKGIINLIDNIKP